MKLLCGNDNRNLAGFLKTTLARFEAIHLSEKGAAKSLIRPKITQTKEKERRKIKEEKRIK